MNETTKKKKRITPKNGVKIIVDREFIGEQSLSEVFIPILYDDLRKTLEDNRTLDNDCKNH